MKRIALTLVSLGAGVLLVAGCKGSAPVARSAPNGGGPGAGPRGRHLIRLLDANRDGVISKDEIDGAPKVLRTLDRNGDGRLTSDEVHPRRRRPSERRGGKLPTATTLGADDGAKRILGVLAQLEQRRIGMMNVPRRDGRLLRLLVETLDAKHVVELGTSNGYSGLWIGLGLNHTGGKLTTFELDARRAALARKHFHQAGLDGRVTMVEGDAHKNVLAIKTPIDLLWIDADKQGYIDYLNKLLPQVRAGGLIVAHNMVHPTPDPRFLKAITSNPALETIFLHMDGPGVAVTLKKRPVQK
ncbi:MAG: class I SAM-dependent methyltransferase [bacterium]